MPSLIAGALRVASGIERGRAVANDRAEEVRRTTLAESERENDRALRRMQMEQATQAMNRAWQREDRADTRLTEMDKERAFEKGYRPSGDVARDGQNLSSMGMLNLPGMAGGAAIAGGAMMQHAAERPTFSIDGQGMTKARPSLAEASAEMLARQRTEERQATREDAERRDRTNFDQSLALQQNSQRFQAGQTAAQIAAQRELAGRRADERGPTREDWIAKNWRSFLPKKVAGTGIQVGEYSPEEAEGMAAAQFDRLNGGASPRATMPDSPRAAPPFGFGGMPATGGAGGAGGGNGNGGPRARRQATPDDIDAALREARGNPEAAERLLRSRGLQ